MGSSSRWLGAALGSMLAFAGHAQNFVVEVITLEFHVASELIPVLRPLLPAAGTVTGLGNRLVVKTTAANLETIRQTLRELDRAPVNLLVSVRQRSARRQESREAEVHGSHRAGRQRIGASIRYGERNRQGQGLQQVRVLEGRFAFIETGQWRPVRKREHRVGTHGVEIRDRVDLQAARNGFEVRPTRLGSDRVRLEIAPHSASFEPGGAITRRQTATEITARLGEWIALGEVAANRHQRSAGVLMGGLDDKVDNYAVEIKVDLLRD